MLTHHKKQAFPANRRATPPPSQPPPPRDHRRAGEVAGGTAAECAAVFCCVPCAVMDLVVLAAYKLPAGLVKKAMGKRNRRRLQRKNRRSKQQQNRQNDGVVAEKKVGPTLLEEHLAKADAAEKTEEVAALEEEMWAQFNGTGFWRSYSQQSAQLPKQTQQLPKVQTGGEMDRV